MGKTFSRQSKHKVFVLILCGVLLLLSQFQILAVQSVALAWIPSSSTNVVGYKIYYGTTSLNYDSLVDVGSTNAVTIAGLMDGTTYYFAAVAVDSAGGESPFSNEAVYTVPSAAATLAVSPGLGGGFSFSVSGISGYQYVVQSSTDLVNWVPVQTNTAPFTFTDTNAVATPQCFYRTYYLPP
jgi:Fibronectin type III domain